MRGIEDLINHKKPAPLQNITMAKASVKDCEKIDPKNRDLMKIRNRILEIEVTMGHL